MSQIIAMFLLFIIMWLYGNHMPGMGAGHQRDQPTMWLGSWGFKPAQPTGTGGRLMTQSHMQHKKSPINTLDLIVRWSLLVGEPPDEPWKWFALIPQREARKLCISNPVRPHLICLFNWLALICILYSQTITVTVVLALVLWLYLVNSPARGSFGDARIDSQWITEGQEASGPPKCSFGIVREVGDHAL